MCKRTLPPGALMSICGLDFGTSNTTLGTIEGQAPVLVALEDAQTTIPSAMFYETDGAVLIGRRAVEAYVEGAPGRLMRSLKSVLGTSLIDETTRLGRERVTFQFEPIAAALEYERQIASEAVALIADIGGGTSDFSIVRLGPDRHGKADRAADILANDGVRIGGTDFD